jgi:hypothetical protein
MFNNSSPSSSKSNILVSFTPTKIPFSLQLGVKSATSGQIDPQDGHPSRFGAIVGPISFSVRREKSRFSRFVRASRLSRSERLVRLVHPTNLSYFLFLSSFFVGLNLKQTLGCAI